MVNRIHSLRYYGAPHDEEGNLLQPERGESGRMSSSGEGHAVCSCGEVSPSLPTGIMRREWFDLHRQDNPVRMPRPAISESDSGATSFIAFPAFFAKHFWAALGKEPSRRAAERAAVEVSWITDEMKIVFFGDLAGVKHAAKIIQDFWAFADKSVPEWRVLKQDEDIASDAHQGQVSATLKRRFYADLAESFFNEKEGQK